MSRVGPVDANLALSSEAPLQLHAKRTPEAKTQFHPEFFVVVTTSSSPDAQQQTFLPPPDPKPTDDTDWGFFWLGWVFGLLWVVGCFRPLCRQPRFPQKQNFRGWIGNVIGKLYGPGLSHVLCCYLFVKQPLTSFWDTKIR